MEGHPAVRRALADFRELLRLRNVGAGIIISILGPVLFGLVMGMSAAKGQVVIWLLTGVGPVLILLVGALVWSFARAPLLLAREQIHDLKNENIGLRHRVDVMEQGPHPQLVFSEPRVDASARMSEQGTPLSLSTAVGWAAATMAANSKTASEAFVGVANIQSDPEHGKGELARGAIIRLNFTLPNGRAFGPVDGQWRDQSSTYETLDLQPDGTTHEIEIARKYPQNKTASILGKPSLPLPPGESEVRVEIRGPNVKTLIGSFAVMNPGSGGILGIAYKRELVAPPAIIDRG